MDAVFSCWIHFLSMILSISFIQFASSQESCAVCKEPDFNCKKIYPDCDSKSLVSVCFADDKYYCVEKEEKYRKCPFCQQDGISCNKLYPNCDSKALLSLCFMDNKYYCVEKQPDDNKCPLCQQNGFLCQNIYPNCDLKTLLSLCFKDNKYHCVEKDPHHDNCQRCKEPGYQCIHSYPNCSSEFTTEVCVSNGHFVCIERLPNLLSSTKNPVTTTKAHIMPSPTINSTEECHFSKIGLQPPVSVTVCQENCLPADKYIDLSKIGICSQGVCCLNKLETGKSPSPIMSSTLKCKRCDIDRGERVEIFPETICLKDKKKIQHYLENVIVFPKRFHDDCTANRNDNQGIEECVQTSKASFSQEPHDAASCMGFGRRDRYVRGSRC